MSTRFLAYAIVAQLWVCGAGSRLSAAGNPPHAGERCESILARLAPGGAVGLGTTLAFEEHEHFTYVVRDLGTAPAHPAPPQNPAEAGSARTFLRRLVFLKPDLFVVEDVVRSSAAAGPAKWTLRWPGQPRIESRRVVVHGADGDLVCETLLPEETDLAYVRLGNEGGPGAEFQVEVTPRVSSRQVRYLHLLRVQSGGGSLLNSYTLTAEDGQLELTVATGDRRFRLWLPPAAIAAGHIAILSAGDMRVLARRPLPSGVLPSGPEGVRLLDRWDAAYRGGNRPGWDTGRPSSNLRAAIEGGVLPRGRAVELGCGTGVNAIYLGQQGFDVTAIDLAPTALGLAEEKARQAGVRVRWLLADVLAVPELAPFDLIFDRGCYHGVRGANAAGYVATLRRLSQPGTRILILAGNANEERQYGPPRVTEAQLRADFGDGFTFEWLRETRFDTANPDQAGALAWSILLQRTAPNTDRP
ncbi:MAG: class I SAM-dependent methyltransferase [Verrucomicrobia bacterium]|nr:class I SAM-dependent methyltransferase [Verrucomicrobiota bacterium]